MKHLEGLESKAARIADNQTQAETGFNYDLLKLEFEDLADSRAVADVAELTAFDRPAVEDLLKDEGKSAGEVLSEAPDLESDSGDSGAESPHHTHECLECGHEFTPQ